MSDALDEAIAHLVGLCITRWKGLEEGEREQDQRLEMNVHRDPTRYLI